MKTEEQNTKLEQLDTLLQFTTASQLRRSIQSTLFAYLMDIEEKIIPIRFKETIEDYYYLIEFLEKLDESK